MQKVAHLKIPAQYTKDSIQTVSNADICDMHSIWSSSTFVESENNTQSISFNENNTQSSIAISCTPLENVAFNEISFTSIQVLMLFLVVNNSLDYQKNDRIMGHARRLNYDNCYTNSQI